MSKELVIKEVSGMSVMSVDDVLRQVNLIQQIMKTVMIDKEHYGTIPGCGSKKALLKPGAEKLGMVFKLRAITDPAKDILITRMENGHREYCVTCHIIAQDGTEVATGIGSCTTMESKYRFRTGDGEMTGIAVNKAYWDKRKTDPMGAAEELKKAANAAGYDGDKFGTKKNDAGVWEITTHGEKVENDNPADQYNTCLKMAHKRAHVSGIILATGCSDVFVQEDIPLPADEVKVEIKPPQEKKADETRITEADWKFLQKTARGCEKSDKELLAIIKKYGYSKGGEIKVSDKQAILDDILSASTQPSLDELPM